LNYGTAEHYINAIHKKDNPSTLSKGLVLSLNSYEGTIEVFNCVFNKNLVFFPSAAFSNAPKFESKKFDPKLFSFFSNEGLNNENQKHFKMSVYNKPLNHSINFFNYLNYQNNVNQYKLTRNVSI